MFFITPVIVIIAVIVILAAVQKKKTSIARAQTGVAIVIIGTGCLCAVSFFGLLKMIFMGGFLSSKGETVGGQIVIVTVFTMLMLLSAAVVVFGLSLFTTIMEQKKMIAGIMLAGLIFPAIFGLTGLLDMGTQNVNFKGVIDYLASKKFKYGRLHWNMDKTEVMNLYREGYSSPPEETCGISGKILFIRYNFKNKLYQIEVLFDTKTKKEQDYFLSCLTSKYGAPVSRQKGAQCGCSTVNWTLPETNIKMTLYDEAINGAIETPPYSLVSIEYTFAPQYLKLKQAAAWGGM